MSSGGAVTGLVLGILMALAIGGAVEGSTADLDSTATDTPSDVPTAVDGGTDSTELGLTANRAAEPDAAVPFLHAPGGNFSPELVDVARSWSTGASTAGIGRDVDADAEEPRSQPCRTRSGRHAVDPTLTAR
jgi:hypothetical protein